MHMMQVTWFLLLVLIANCCSLSILNDGDTFDYIVVGAGGGGAPAAARLALAGASVLLVEAGGDALDYQVLTKIPGVAIILLGSSLDWQYPTISNNMSCKASQGDQCRFSRGKCPGGSTSINYMMYTRGNPADFDDLDIKGWAWEDVKPYFLKYEGLQALSKLPHTSIPYHNTNGTMKIDFFSGPKNSWRSRIVQGFKSLDVPFNPDANADSQIGASRVVGYVYEGERMSTARGYLERSDVKQKLKVAVNTQCTGVIMNKNNKAIGITAEFNMFFLKDKFRLYARKEVILSAGTIGTAQILMLSGIGPADHLRSLGIPVRANLPVGNDISDHVLPLVYISVDPQKNYEPVVNIFKLGLEIVTDFLLWLFFRKGKYISDGVTDITAFLNTRCYNFHRKKLEHNHPVCELPTLQLINSFIEHDHLPGVEDVVQKVTGFKEDIIRQLSDVNKRNALLVMSPVVLRPYSRGTIRLASKDPLANPAIFPNYLGDKRDIDEMLRSITILEDLVETPAFRARNAKIVHLNLPGCPLYSADRVGYWHCYCRHMTYSVFHAVGSARLGAVLDAQLRVRRVDGLRVADLSALPELPRGNTAAAAIAIGERVADFILHGNAKHPHHILVE